MNASHPPPPVCSLNWPRGGAVTGAGPCGRPTSRRGLQACTAQPSHCHRRALNSRGRCSAQSPPLRVWGGRPREPVAAAPPAAPAPGRLSFPQTLRQPQMLARTWSGSAWRGRPLRGAPPAPCCCRALSHSQGPPDVLWPRLAPCASNPVLCPSIWSEPFAGSRGHATFPLPKRLALAALSPCPAPPAAADAPCGRRPAPAAGGAQHARGACGPPPRRGARRVRQQAPEPVQCPKACRRRRSVTLHTTKS
jgi:hypothetical protein